MYKCAKKTAKTAGGKKANDNEQQIYKKLRNTRAGALPFSLALLIWVANIGYTRHTVDLVVTTGTLKTRDWKTRDHQKCKSRKRRTGKQKTVAWVKNAGLENTGTACIWIAKQNEI